MKKLLSTLVVLFSCFLVSGQDQSLHEDFDKIVSVNNTKLSYGVIYKEKYRKKDKDNHNFLIDENFKKGSVLYRNQKFNNIDLKYELVDDFIVVKINNQEQQISIIPEKTLVERFVIENRSFIYSEDYGFLEELLVRDQFAVFKKHQKSVRENRDADYRYHTFRKKENTILRYKNSFYQIDTKRDFYKIFPTQKKYIATFYKSNTYLLNNDYKTFVAKLITSLPQE